MYCSLDKATTIHGQLIFIAVLNAFLSITAFLGNVLVLVALRKDSSCILQLNSLASLLTLTAISVERLLALLLRLRYRQVITLKRTRWIIITFWVLPAGYATIRLFWNFSLTIVAIPLCLVTSAFSHTKIFFSLRRHQSQVQDHVQQPNQTNRLNIARFRTAVSTALWMQFTLIVCYLPLVISRTHLVVNTELSSSFIVAVNYTVTLVFLNSSLNPIFYCWKIAEVRRAMKQTIRQILCC